MILLNWKIFYMDDLFWIKWGVVVYYVGDLRIFLNGWEKKYE